MNNNEENKKEIKFPEKRESQLPPTKTATADAGQSKSPSPLPKLWGYETVEGRRHMLVPLSLVRHHLPGFVIAIRADDNVLVAPHASQLFEIEPPTAEETESTINSIVQNAKPEPNSPTSAA